VVDNEKREEKEREKRGKKRRKGGLVHLSPKSNPQVKKKKSNHKRTP
jgi:hypothetical protein